MGVQVTANFQQMVNLLAADTTTFADPGADTCPHVILIKASFTPAPDLEWATLTDNEADFDGYIQAGIGAATGTQNTALDPLTADYLLQLKPPLGGFRWETAGLDNLPQTIYGFAIGNPDSAVLYYSARFPEAITLNGVNQVIEVEDAQIRFTPIGVS